MLELLFWVLLGCVLGIFTGLIPGIHVNLVSLMALFFAEGRIEFVLLIVAMSVVHSFFDFIPGILFGAPDEGSFLSILPGHRYLLRRRGFRAIKLTVFGGVIAGLLGLMALPVFLVFMGKIFEFLGNIIFFVLLVVLGLMVFSEKGIKGKGFALLVISLSGVLGIVLLGNGVVRMPLFVCITGFFAVSTLVHSVMQNECVKKQRVSKEKFSFEGVFSGSVIGLVAGSTVSLIPSIGASQAAFLVRELIGRIRTESYLVILGGINTVNLMFSFFVLYAIGKTRTGPAAIVKQFFSLQEGHLILLVGVILIAIAFGAFMCLVVGKFFSERIHLIPYKKMNLVVLGFLFMLGFVFSGIVGVFVMGVCAAIGLIAITKGVKRTHCMGFLMLPTIVFYSSVLF